MIRSILPVALTAALVACSPGAPAPTSAPSAAAAPSGAAAGGRSGTIVKITDAIWAIAPEGQPTERYCFEGPLATPLRVEGKRVHFSGTVGVIPPNVRLACTPFTLATVAAD